jgi:hypothetical protein
VSYCLIEKVGSERVGKPLFFKEMTGIGPMTTPNVEERAVFGSREIAERCPAMFHSLSTFEVRELSPEDSA